MLQIWNLKKFRGFFSLNYNNINHMQNFVSNTKNVKKHIYYKDVNKEV